jgi:hypothetical protein
VDNLEQLESEGLENMLREGAVAVAEVAALAHEKSVIDAALAAVGAGTGKTWNAAADPIADVDDAILSVIKAAKYGSLMGVGVLFGATAWKIFKNQDKVRGRFVVGNGGGKASLGLAVPTEQSASQMFVGTPEVRTSYMIYDTRRRRGWRRASLPAGHGGAVFARKAAPEPARPELHEDLPADEQVHGAGELHARRRPRRGGEVRLVEDVKVTNSAACVRLNGRLEAWRAQTVAAYRQAVQNNPACELNEDENTVPKTGFFHALNVIFFNLGMEMGVEMDDVANSLMIRADLWKSAVEHGEINPLGLMGGGGRRVTWRRRVNGGCWHEAQCVVGAVAGADGGL